MKRRYYPPITTYTPKEEKRIKEVKKIAEEWGNETKAKQSKLAVKDISNYEGFALVKNTTKKKKKAD